MKKHKEEYMASRLAREALEDANARNRSAMKKSVLILPSVIHIVPKKTLTRWSWVLLFLQNT